MTTEEKAKSYDEALKDMMVIYPNLKGDAKLAVEHAFPELRESEDERIRKKCIELIKRVIPSGDSQSQESKEILDCIAYLEKQKEQKPADEQFPPLEGLDAIKAKYYDYGFKLGFDEGVESVKPAERIEDSVKFEEGFRAGRESGLRDGQKYVLNNLASYGLCKPAEWSEEDEKMLTDISWAIRHCAYDDKKKERVMKWFNDDYRKSLRPSWKPIEELEKMLEE